MSYVSHHLRFSGIDQFQFLQNPARILLRSRIGQFERLLSVAPIVLWSGIDQFERLLSPALMD